MSNMLKCPNPSCPYIFDPSQVPVGVVLSCPRCAMQFTLGAPAASPPSTTAAVPPAQPQAPFPPTESDFEAVGRSAPQPAGGRIATPPRDRSRSRTAAAAAAGAPAEDQAPRSNFQVFAIAGVVAVLLAGAALAIIFTLMRRDRGDAIDTVSRWPELNAGVEALPAGWARDDSVRVKVGAPYVVSFKRENPEGYVAFGANGFGSDNRKGRNPRPSEMKTDLMQAFTKLFVRTGAEDSLRPDPPLADKWLGEPLAQNDGYYPNGFSFRAQSADGTKWRGEAYTVAHKGMAYYWLGWSLEDDFEGLKGELATFRNKFKLLDLRKDWNPTQSSVVDYKGDKVPYTITDAEEVWKEAPVADELTDEPNLDKLLRARITPKGDRHALPTEAELRVYVLDSGGDPGETAREFAQKMETDRIRMLNSEFKPPTYEILTDAEQGDPIVSAAPRTAPFTRMRSKVAESRDASRLIVASGVKVGDKMVVVRCWCEWSKRNVLEARLVQIASSLR